MKSAGPTPTVRSTRPVSSSCRISDITPAIMLNVPKNIASSSVSGHRLLRDRLELPPRDRRRQRRDQNQRGNRPEIGRLANQPQGAPQREAIPDLARGRRVVADVLGAIAPDHDDDAGAQEERDRHEAEHALGAELRNGRARRKPADDPPENRAAADEAERSLGLARRQHVVGERPHLRRRQHREDADPDVDDDEERAGFVGGGRGPQPETEGGHGEERQAADLQVAQVGAVAEPDVGAGGNADQGGDRDVDVGKVDRAVAIEEQGVAGGLAGHARRHGQEQVGEDRKGPAKFPAVQAKCTFR